MVSSWSATPVAGDWTNYASYTLVFLQNQWCSSWMGCIRTESVVLLQAERCLYRISGTRGCAKKHGFAVVSSWSTTPVVGDCTKHASLTPPDPTFGPPHTGAQKSLPFLVRSIMRSMLLRLRHGSPNWASPDLTFGPRHAGCQKA